MTYNPPPLTNRSRQLILEAEKGARAAAKFTQQFLADEVEFGSLLNEPVSAPTSSRSAPPRTSGRLAFTSAFDEEDTSVEITATSSANTFYNIHTYLAIKLATAGDAHGRVQHFQRLLREISLGIQLPGRVTTAITESLHTRAQFEHGIFKDAHQNRYAHLLSSLSRIDEGSLKAQYSVYCNFLHSNWEIGTSATLPPHVRMQLDQLKVILGSVVAPPSPPRPQPAPAPGARTSSPLPPGWSLEWDD